MSYVFQLPLNTDETNCLIDLLESQQTEQSTNLLMIYYMQRGLFQKFLQTQSKLQSTQPASESSNMRAALMKNYENLVSPMHYPTSMTASNQNIASTSFQYPLNINLSEASSKPVSTAPPTTSSILFK